MNEVKIIREWPLTSASSPMAPRLRLELYMDGPLSARTIRDVASAFDSCQNVAENARKDLGT